MRLMLKENEKEMVINCQIIYLTFFQIKYTTKCLLSLKFYYAILYLVISEQYVLIVNYTEQFYKSKLNGNYSVTKIIEYKY